MATLTLPHSRKYDVRRFGYNWGGDLGAAINAAIAAAPNTNATVGIYANAHVATQIHIPTSPDAQAHQVATQIVIPTTKSVEIVCEDGTASALLEWVGAGDYMFWFQNGQRVVKLRNLSLWKGGVEIGETGTVQGVRKDWGIYDCHIIEAPEWAIVTRALSQIGGTIDNVTFRANGVGSADGGDIYFAFEQSDVNVIKDCDFLTCHGTNIRLRTSGVHVIDCDFEQRPAGYESKPYVHLDVGPNANVGQKGAGDVRFTRCRFGNEAVHPRAAVVIGPNDGTIAANTMDDIVFSECRFRGPNGAVPTATNGFTVFEFNSPPAHLEVTDCSIFASYAWFGLENYLDGTTNANAARLAYANTVNSVVTMVDGVFDHGGWGWDLAENDRHIRPAVEASETQNVVQDAHDLGLWNLLPVTARTAAATADPLGGTSAYEISKTGAGNSGIETTLTLLRTGEPMVLSFWAQDPTKSGVDASGAPVRVQIVGTGMGNGPEFSWPFRASSRWERFWVQVPEFQSLVASLQLFVGLESSATGVVNLWGPQLEYGWGPPSPLVMADAAGLFHAPRQHQGLVVGSAQHGYGAAAPTAGYYNRGDIVWHTAPSAGDIGWVCTASGTPGTWVAMAGGGGGLAGAAEDYTITNPPAARRTMPDTASITLQELAEVVATKLGDDIGRGIIQ